MFTDVDVSLSHHLRYVYDNASIVRSAINTRRDPAIDKLSVRKPASQLQQQARWDEVTKVQIATYLDMTCCETAAEEGSTDFDCKSPTLTKYIERNELNPFMAH